jgi:hypothetical protein
MVEYAVPSRCIETKPDAAISCWVAIAMPQGLDTPLVL